MKYAIGIDLGGTNIKVAAVRQDGEILVQTSSETGDEKRANWTENVRQQIESLENKLNHRAAWLGLASPGIVGGDNCSMASVTGHLTDLQGFDWAEFLKPHQPILLNDAHAALLGEVACGAARGCRNAILITLGTGVGGAILADGQLLKGNLGRAGHLGHICLDVNGAPDSNGIPGTLETAIGNCTLASRSENSFSSTEQLVAAYAAGDKNAKRIWLQSIYQLACAIASLINVVDPEIVIIGGGIARANDCLFKPLSLYLDRMEWRPLGFRVPIVSAQIGSFAGAVGAAFNAMNDTATPPKIKPPKA